jgi:RNA polymerase sigma factor (sigma-70 family)
VETYDTFYLENKSRVFAYLLRLTGNYHLSMDLTQESFTRYLSRYGRNDNNGSLLFTIARNAALDAMRKRHEESLRGDDEASPAADPECELIQKQAIGRMIAAIQKLNPVDRELVALLATESFSYKAIGQILNIRETNVRVKVHRARLRLKAILNDGGQ